MSNILSRVLKHPVDYKGIFRNTNIALKEHRNEGENVHTFIFTPEKPLTWKAGQHSIFTMSDKDIVGKKWRAFSVASAPHEGVIQISTNINENPSGFKQRLLDLNIGDTIKMHGPFGEFYLKPKMKHVVGIVGGIGITPFRSILCDVAKNNLQTPITLIYSAREKYTYKDELDAWTEQNPNIKIIYTHTPEEVQAELSKHLTNCTHTDYFFISGAPRMIEALQTTCLENKINKKNVISDPFKGY